MLHILCSVLFCGVMVNSCTVVRDYPTNKNFHFENNVKINGTLSKEQVSLLKTRLLGQLEDSVQIRVASKIPWPSFPYFIPVSVMERPSAFHPDKVRLSATNMRFLMNNVGYRKSTVSFDTLVKRKKDQKRVTTTFSVTPGPLYTIDTSTYLFNDTILQSIAVSAAKDAVIKKGSAFDYDMVDQEISRLTDVLQNNGFYKIAKEDIIVEADTNIVSLLNASLDPISFALVAAAAKVKPPSAHLTFRLRENIDSSHMVQYEIGSVLVYPDLTAEEADSVSIDRWPDSSQVSIIPLHNSFNENFIKSNIVLRPGAPFNRQDYSKTLNNFNKLGSWQNISINAAADDTTGKINYILKLLPAKRQFFSVDLEGSSIINTSQLIQVGSGRVGLATNFTLRNRNIGKRAIQLENSLRTGVEFNNFEKILSGEITLTNRLTFPWLVVPFLAKTTSLSQQTKTVASADFSYINRFKYFELNTFNTFWGYEWKPNPNSSWQVRPLNIELTRFIPDSLFRESIKDFPLLLYTYNNGLVIGASAQYNRNLTPNGTKKISLLKLYAEESGLGFGALFYNQTKPGKAFSNLYRFVKVDAEFKHIINYRKSSLHMRLFAGGGLALTTGSKKGEVTLPFFKSYVAGGPNSMRGWSIRKLGIGSNVFYDTIAGGGFNDKYADLHLEGNLELRFNLFQFYGFWMRGALFTDVGNIWFRNDLDGLLNNADLKLNRLGRDLAVASGMGARIDFNYFLLRFDLGFPVKDPRYGPENTGNPNVARFYAQNTGGWFVDNVWNKPVFQFAIGYPF